MLVYYFHLFFFSLRFMKLYVNFCLTIRFPKEKNDINIFLSCVKLNIIYFGKPQVKLLKHFSWCIFENISIKKKLCSPLRFPLSTFLPSILLTVKCESSMAPLYCMPILINLLLSLWAHPNSTNFDFREAVFQNCSVKKMFLEISQNSQESTCSRVSF